MWCVASGKSWSDSTKTCGGGAISTAMQCYQKNQFPDFTQSFTIDTLEKLEASKEITAKWTSESTRKREFLLTAEN
jgi:hypothetical protein